MDKIEIFLYLNNDLHSVLLVFLNQKFPRLKEKGERIFSALFAVSFPY